MISEASRREKIANAVLGATFALSAAQSPKDFVRTGNIESPGTALMQTWGRKRGEAERNLNSARVSDPARNRKKMKTFREFLEEAVLISEMRKEDKVAGKQKTPLYNVKTSKKLEKTPEGKWEKKTTTTKRPSEASTFAKSRLPHAHGLSIGVSGIHRGVKKSQQVQPYQRKPGAKARKHHNDFFRYHHGEVADNKRKERENAPGFKQASQSWSSSKPETKPSARARMSAAADKLGLK